jgi:hypothetical protein
MAQDHTEVALSIAALCKVHSQVHHLIACIFGERSTYASFTGRPNSAYALYHATSPERHPLNPEFPSAFVKSASDVVATYVEPVMQNAISVSISALTVSSNPQPLASSHSTGPNQTPANPTSPTADDTSALSGTSTATKPRSRNVISTPTSSPVWSHRAETVTGLILHDAGTSTRCVLYVCDPKSK